MDQLLGNASSPQDEKARRIALKAVEEALASVDPSGIIKRTVSAMNKDIRVKNLTIDLRGKRLFVIGGGKASGTMAEALEEILGDRITGGVVNIPRGTKDFYHTKRIFLNEASHPIPDQRGVNGVRRMMDLVEEIGGQDVVLCLISGGGSALMPLPKEGIDLSDLQEVNNALLKCGARIEEINAVRKHLSAFKGGQLAKAAFPAFTLGLILSDVVGDPLEVIASGPTAPDPTTYKDAIGVLKKYDIWEAIPESVKKTLTEGASGKLPETPKPGDKIFLKVFNFVIGNNRTAVSAAREYLAQEGLNTLTLGSYIEGEARHVGKVFAGLAREEAIHDNPLPRPAAILAGGETTVSVIGSGRGGRNQELVLSAAEKMADLDGVALVSVGTDGIDGASDAAGAIVDGHTYERAGKEGLNPIAFLRENDSYSFFTKLGDAIFTGPTGTNVNDLMILVAL